MERDTRLALSNQLIPKGSKRGKRRVGQVVSACCNMQRRRAGMGGGVQGLESHCYGRLAVNNDRGCWWDLHIYVNKFSERESEVPLLPRLVSE